MINSRAIEHLHPKIQDGAQSFLDKCEEAGIDVIITSTLRDHECQQKLYDKGRTEESKKKKERKVTNAKPGYSWHNWGLAFDFVPVVNGKAIWNDKEVFTQCGEIAESLGFTWAGRWKRFKEMAHCQYTGGLTLADMRAGKELENSPWAGNQ